MTFSFNPLWLEDPMSKPSSDATDLTAIPAGAGHAGAFSSPLTGSAAALITVIIWSGWIIATRFAGETEIDPVSIGLLRYGPPALLLAPVWGRCGLLPRRCPWWIIALMVAGSGAPFLLLAAFAMQTAPAAEVGALLPGTMPLWAALIGVLLGVSRFTRAQWLGYGLIASGIVLMLSITIAVAGGSDANASTGAAWQGQGLLLLAAASWAIYSHAFKHSGLTPLQGAAIVAAWSFLICLALAACFGTELAAMPTDRLFFQLVVQGILSGLIAIFSYGLAVAALGAARAAAFSAVAPVLATIGGALLLGEHPGRSDLVSIVLITIGVALASGIRQQRAGPVAR
jgi:drug/metabolite transporter (DMT)-like permease